MKPTAPTVQVPGCHISPHPPESARRTAQVTSVCLGRGAKQRDKVFVAAGNMVSSWGAGTRTASLHPPPSCALNSRHHQTYLLAGMRMAALPLPPHPTP